MNGSINNHTLSPNELIKLIEIIDSSTIKCIEKIELHTNDLLWQISKMWADENAVKFTDYLTECIEYTISEFIKKANDTKKCIDMVSVAYGIASGKKTVVNNGPIRSTPVFHKDFVKTTFDGDRFGMDAEGGIVFFNLVTSYEKSIKEIMTQFLNDINRNNAFGNTIIITRLRKYAQETVDLLMESLRRISNCAKNIMNETIQNYERIPTDWK